MYNPDQAKLSLKIVQFQEKNFHHFFFYKLVWIYYNLRARNHQNVSICRKIVQCFHFRVDEWQIGRKSFGYLSSDTSHTHARQFSNHHEIIISQTCSCLWKRSRDIIYPFPILPFFCFFYFSFSLWKLVSQKALPLCVDFSNQEEIQYKIRGFTFIFPSFIFLLIFFFLFGPEKLFPYQ